MRSSGFSESRVRKTHAQPSSHQRRSSSRVGSPLSSNSWSRWRSGFSPSLVRKSVKRDRMLPEICLTRIAMEFDSGSSVIRSCSSVTCATAPSAMRLYPRSWRRTSSRKCEPRASMAALMIPWHSPTRYAGNPLRKLAPTPYGLRRFFVVRFERHPPIEPAEGTARDLSGPYAYVGADASSARPRCFSAASFGSSRAVTHPKSNGLPRSLRLKEGLSPSRNLCVLCGRSPRSPRFKIFHETLSNLLRNSFGGYFFAPKPNPSPTLRRRGFQFGWLPLYVGGR